MRFTVRSDAPPSSSEGKADPLTRILRVFSRLNIGGPALHVVHLSAGLASRGFETRLVVGLTDEREGDFHDFAEARGVRATILPELGRAIHPLRDVRAFLALGRLIREFRPDIVHTHTAKAGALGRLAARMANVPVIVHTYHGHVLSGYFNPVTSALFRGIEKALAPASSALLAVSDSVRDDLVRLGVAPADRVHVIPLGLDLEPLAAAIPRGALRKEAKWGEDVRLVGIVGRLVPIKDIDTFIDAAVIVARELPDVRFAVVGDGEERERLEKRGVSLLGDRVRFFGWRKDPPAVFGDLDVVVNTSRNEGTPVALIEALAAGRPVIATSVGGTPDLLERGRYGRLVPARSVDELARAIGAVLKAPEGDLAKATAGRAAVLIKYSVGRLLDDMAALYVGLMRASSPRSGARQ